jgi:cyclic beta-1,2-glucan synthetase
VTKKQNLVFEARKKETAKNGPGQDFLIDKRLGYYLFKKLESDFKKAQKNLQRYYKESKKQQVNEGQRVALLWFLENYHYIEDSESFLEEAFDVKSASLLPILDKSKEVRVIKTLSGFIDDKKRLNLGGLVKYFKSHQKKEALILAELWFVPTALQIILILNIEKSLSSIYKNSKPEKGTKIDREVKHLILSLIAVNKINWKNFVEDTSKVEEILHKDPAKIYPKMDFKTRDAYRHLVENIAKRSDRDEFEIAALSLELAKSEKKGKAAHLGDYLAGARKERLEKSVGYRPGMRESIKRFITKTRGRYLILTITVLSFLLALYLMKLSDNFDFFWYLVPLWLLILVALEAVMNRVLVKVFPPQPLFKLDHELGIADESRTLVTVPTLLTEKPSDPKNLLENLELNYLANDDPNIFFGLLLSFQESKDKEDQPTEAQLKNLKLLEELLAELNQKYPQEEDKFIIMFRKRSWSDCQGACIEWERKRGKIIELTRLLRGKPNTDFHLVTAKKQTLDTIRYVITLDQGELLTKGAAKKLIASISHPLNQPISDPDHKVVRSGYGIIQPTMLPVYSEGRSLFEKMAGGRGWDSYSGLSSNVYQDIFSEGAYFGKGIFDVDTFLNVIDGRFPEDTILSHDLIEGFYCRTGYASDIQVFEDEPLNYISFAQRKERWIRGDWQNIFWLLGSIRSEKSLKKEINPLFFHHKWRIFNNLLRSLAFPLATYLLLYNWFFLDPALAIANSFLILALLNTESLLALIDVLPPQRSVYAWRYYVLKTLRSLSTLLIEVLFKTIFMFHLAIISVSAICRALYRVLISHKKTLEWQAFHLTKGSGNNSIIPILNFMALSQIAALLILVWHLTKIPNLVSVIVILGWVLAPFAAYLYSMTEKKESIKLSEKEINRIRLIGLKTWRFFEELVSDETNQLPPDHYLETGKGRISRMTSITNIGAYLLSVKAASDLGYITNREFLKRTKITLDSLNDLERHNGHFYNWYDVKNKSALSPRYISTVDSGNLAASLMTIKESVIELRETKINANFKEAFNDLLIMMLRAHDESALTAQDTHKLGRKLESLRNLNLSCSYDYARDSYLSLNSIIEALDVIKNEYLGYKKTHEKNAFLYWLTRAEKLANEGRVCLLSVFPWFESDKEKGPIGAVLDEFELEPSTKSLREAIYRVESGSLIKNLSTKDLKILNDYLDRTKEYFAELDNSIDESLGIIKELLAEGDFSFLYDKDRELFRIGYNVDKKRFDKNYYDLYASEARLASFISLANNDINLEHWAELGRPLAHHKGKLLLLSWGGSIFEYFFPQMFLTTKRNTLLDISQKSAFDAQVEYGKDNNIPWGVSESSYVQKSRSMDYLYKMHGIPTLGIRRILKKDLVVAPYATFLALEQNPIEAISNIKSLQHLGAEGKFGLYESVDFSRSSDGETAKVYMSHHQGAIIISIVNYLKNRPFEKRFMRNAEVKALAYLLEEEVIVRGKLKSTLDITKQIDPKLKVSSSIPEKEVVYLGVPLMHLISNGRLKSFISSRGSGYLEYGNLELTPFKKDPVIDSFGSFIYIKDNRKEKIWSATYQPTLAEPDDYQYRFEENYYQVVRQDFGIECNLEIFIHPKINAEVRALTLTNKSQQRRFLSVASFAEISIFNHGEFWAHPNFQKIKLESKLKNKNMIVFTKRTSHSERSPLFAHLAFFSKCDQQRLSAITDRAAFIGGGDLISPEAFSKESSFVDSPGLDKAYSFKSDLFLLPLEKKTIYFVNLYAGKNERLKQGLKILGDYDQLTKVTDLQRPKKDRKRFQKTTLQQIISLLFYYNRQPEVASGVESLARNQFELDWSVPTIALELKISYSKTFVSEALGYLSKIIAKGMRLNIIIITHEKDEYSQKTRTFVDRAISVIESDKNNQAFSLGNFVTIINSAAITPETREGLISASSLYWDASKRSLDSLVEQEFKRI